MADLTQTAANVRITSTSLVTIVNAGETVTPGMPGYKLAADSEYYKASSSTSITAAADGIFIGDADDGDRVSFCTKGDMDIGATLVIGESYFVSNTTGKIMPSGDVSTGEFVTYLGTADTTSNINIVINQSGVART
jgi:hypothetical protein